jgi:hypothetical protein
MHTQSGDAQGTSTGSDGKSGRPEKQEKDLKPSGQKQRDLDTNNK